MKFGKDSAVIPFIALILLLAPASWAQTFNFEMDREPALDGWIVQRGFFGSFGSVHSVANGLLTISTDDYYEFRAPSAIWEDRVNNSVGWKIDTRMRIIDSTGYNLKLWIHDNTNLNTIDITPDAVYLDLIAIPTPDRTYPANIGHDFHTYHVEGQGQHLLVEVDGQTAFDVVRTNHPAGTLGLIFGDMWGISPHWPNVSEWDYFRVTVPEPTMLSVILLLACTSLTRASKRLRTQQPIC
jgi:hypothetical protein